MLHIDCSYVPIYLLLLLIINNIYIVHTIYITQNTLPLDLRVTRHNWEQPKNPS